MEIHEKFLILRTKGNSLLGHAPQDRMCKAGGETGTNNLGMAEQMKSARAKNARP